MIVIIITSLPPVEPEGRRMTGGFLFVDRIDGVARGGEQMEQGTGTDRTYRF